MSLLIKMMMIPMFMIAASTAQHPTPAPKDPPVVAPANQPATADDAGEFLVVPLKNANANDIRHTVHDLLMSRNGSGPLLNPGPDEKTLIVRDFKPAQKENILKMIAMFDIKQPEGKEAGKQKGGRHDWAPSPAARDVRVFPLQHTTPDNALATLIPLFKNASLVANPSTNSIIVNSSNADIATIEGLLTHLDKASDQPRNAAPGVRTIQLKHRATDDVSKKLMSLLGGFGDRDARVASDEGRGKLILRGPADFLEFAEKVIAELDVPAQMIQFEFAFFSADQNASATGESGEAGPIPADLEAVGKELQRFGRVKLLGRLVCNSLEDHQFLVEGLLGEGLSAKVSGSIINAVTDGSIQLNVKGNVRLTRAASGDPKAAPQSSAFEINTTVVTRRGDTVVIGSAPAGWAPGESAIMVLQAKQ